MVRLRCPRCGETVTAVGDLGACSCGTRLRAPELAAAKPGVHARRYRLIGALVAVLVVLVGLRAGTALFGRGGPRPDPAGIAELKAPSPAQVAAASERLTSIPPGEIPRDTWVPPAEGEPESGDPVPGMVLALRGAGATDAEIRNLADDAGAKVIGQDTKLSLVQFWVTDNTEQTMTALSTGNLVRLPTADRYILPTTASNASPESDLAAASGQDKETWIQDLARFSEIGNTRRNVHRNALAVLEAGWVNEGYSGLPLVHRAGKGSEDTYTADEFDKDDEHATTVARLACGNRKGKATSLLVVPDTDTGMANNCDVRSLNATEYSATTGPNGLQEYTALYQQLYDASEEARVVNVSLTWGESASDGGTNPDAQLAACKGDKALNAKLDSNKVAQFREVVGGWSSLFVLSAGNNGCDEPDFVKTALAGLPNVILVGSIDHDSELSGFSNYGPLVDIAAPGGTSWSYGHQKQMWPIPGVANCDTECAVTGPDSRKGGGTSFAAPVVSAAAMILAEADENATAADLKSTLIKAAEGRHATGRNRRSKGDKEAKAVPLLDAKNARDIQELRVPAPPEAPSSTAPPTTKVAAPLQQPGDLLEVLDSYLAAWWNDTNPATIAAWSSPQALSDLGALAKIEPAAGWLSYHLEFDPENCELDLEGIGSCEVSLFKPNTHVTALTLEYTYVEASDAFQITAVVQGWPVRDNGS